MYLVLIRHTESVKNINQQFSSDEETEALTVDGQSNARFISTDLNSFKRRLGIKSIDVYAANSKRAIDTAEFIAEHLGTSVIIEDNLKSTRPGALKGVSEQEARISHPIFIKQLELFRHGLYNAYNFDVAEGKEPKKDFEKRVSGTLENILKTNPDGLKVIVAHRSTITYILIYIARKLYKYPENFSGYVPLDLGKISIIRLDKSAFSEILFVNSESSILNQIS